MKLSHILVIVLLFAIGASKWEGDPRPVKKDPVCFEQTNPNIRMWHRAPCSK